MNVGYRLVASTHQGSSFEPCAEEKTTGFCFWRTMPESFKELNVFLATCKLSEPLM